MFKKGYKKTREAAPIGSENMWVFDFPGTLGSM